MIKTTAIVTVALAATLAQANAAKRHYHQTAIGGFTSAPARASSYYGRYYGPRVTPGPIWAGPNECWTDEGYGRYGACNARGY
jgi:uncharacterized membrane protein